jgi:hypothetical protein
VIPVSIRVRLARHRAEVVMQYLLLIYEDQNLGAAMDEKAQKDLVDAYWAYTKELKDSGAWVAGEALQPTTSATTVRVRSGRTTTTDGPFAETKEQLGGFYMIDVPDLDQALKWAAKLPSSKTGSIEVRPIVKFG